jgi:hypothetical protein
MVVLREIEATNPFQYPEQSIHYSTTWKTITDNVKTHFSQGDTKVNVASITSDRLRDNFRTWRLSFEKWANGEPLRSGQEEPTGDYGEIFARIVEQRKNQANDRAAQNSKFEQDRKHAKDALDAAMGGLVKGEELLQSQNADLDNLQGRAYRHSKGRALGTLQVQEMAHHNSLLELKLQKSVIDTTLAALNSKKKENQYLFEHKLISAEKFLESIGELDMQIEAAQAEMQILVKKV